MTIPRNCCIALCTDFGGQDGYVATLQAVIANIAPRARLIDISHDIPPYDIVHGAVTLKQVYRFFPRKTIFVGVVDPGVGSTRKPILVVTQDYFFIGPDNGLLSLALAEQKITHLVHLTEKKYWFGDVSHTCHGRDIFAPVAAHLARGTPSKKFGPLLKDYHRLAGLEVRRQKNKILGRVLTFDRFGSAFTNLERSSLDHKIPGQVRAAGKKIRWASHYAEGRLKEVLAIFSSSGLLEIAANQGSAQAILQLKRGAKVVIDFGARKD